MLLALDVGNTNVTAGVFEGDRLVRLWRLATEKKTADEYGAVLGGLLGRDAAGGAVDGVAIGSVVPALTGAFEEAARRHFRVEPLTVDHRTRTGVRLAVDHPAEVGADRILNALAALRLFGGPAVVLDFGTATTFDCVSKNGYYLGGAILVGARLASDALASGTAKLPQVEVRRPRRVIGRNTVECIQAGLFHGYLGMVERVLDLTVKEMGGRPRLLVTGGLGGLYAPHLSRKNVLVPDLTLQGLRLAFEAVRGRKGAQ
jgi:type III pantothenate kinase